VTREIKEQIFGLNAARILGIDVEAFKQKAQSAKSTEPEGTTAVAPAVAL
jgi:hypothetical protein